MRLSIAFVALLIATGAVSLPNSDSPDSTVPENHPHVDKDYDDHYEDHWAHTDAKATVEQLTQTGKSSDECAKLADATLKEITNGVAANQKMLNALPTGASCAKEGQAAVDAAKKALTNANASDKAAKAAQHKANTAPVKFDAKGVTELKEGDCSAWEQDPAYIKAKATKKAADKKAAVATGAAQGASDNLDAAKKAQRQAIDDCNCKTHKAHEKAWKAANSNSAENKKSWRKAHLMKCVLSGTTMTQCNIPSVPKVTKPPKDASVAKNGCEKTPLYLGCYADNSNRDFKSGPNRYGYKRRSCAKKCASSYPNKCKYFALQDNGRCSCDNTYSTPSSTYPKKPDNQCNKGGVGQGGAWRNAVYDNPYCKRL